MKTRAPLVIGHVLAVIRDTFKKRTKNETPNSTKTASQRKPRRKACCVAVGVVWGCLGGEVGNFGRGGGFPENTSHTPLTTS